MAEWNPAMRFSLRTLLLVVWLAPPVVIGLIEYVDSSTDLQYYAAYATSGTWLEQAVGEALVGRGRQGCSGASTHWTSRTPAPAAPPA